MAARARHYPAGELTLRTDVPGARMWAVGLENAELTYFEVEPHSRFDEHSHESEQITLVLEGELCFEVDGRVERHRVIGILYVDGRLLGGERVHASERCARLMCGDALYDEMEPVGD